MNNKPVAWIKNDTLIYISNYNYASITIQVQKTNSVGFDIPLYTHPADLTDEEIAIIRKEVWDDNKFISEIFNDFARAILRKAQEK